MAASVLCIPADHPSLPGHFPGRPVVPGVVILDHAAARAGALLGVSHGPRRIAQVKFVAPLLPAQEARLELDADTAQQRVRFRLLRDGVLLAAGELAFSP
jgi:3-hydroxymyristoyl/3-hydroxydecanoyl-(acyl carrier protein) dehydratase